MNLYSELQDKLSEHNPTEVDELILDDLFENVATFSEQNKKDLEKYNNLIHLSLNGFGLESLKNFPKLPSLQVLEIRQNKLNGSDFGALKELYPELYKLKVGENPIKSLDVFKSLSSSNIKKIEILETPASTAKDYMDNLFKIMNNVEIIDGKTKEGDEVSSTLYEDDEGEFDENDMEDEEFDGNDGEDELDEYEDEEEQDEESGSEKPKNGKH